MGHPHARLRCLLSNGNFFLRSFTFTKLLPQQSSSYIKIRTSVRHISKPISYFKIHLLSGISGGQLRGTISLDPAVNAIAHAILGGAVAVIQGNSVAAGATGAATGELAARAIAGIFPLPELLHVLGLARSSYFYHRAALKAGDKYATIRTMLTDIFNSNYQCYGYRRLHAMLRHEGVRLSEKVVRRLMVEEQLVECRMRRLFRQTENGNVLWA